MRCQIWFNVVFAQVVGLALGLGLGLGLQSDNNDDDDNSPQPPAEPTGCATFTSPSQRRHVRDVRTKHSRKRRWLDEADCPELGEPVCPEGLVSCFVFRKCARTSPERKLCSSS